MVNWCVFCQQSLPTWSVTRGESGNSKPRAIPKEWSPNRATSNESKPVKSTVRTPARLYLGESWPMERTLNLLLSWISNEVSALPTFSWITKLSKKEASNVKQGEKPYLEWSLILKACLHSQQKQIEKEDLHDNISILLPDNTMDLSVIGGFLSQWNDSNTISLRRINSSRLVNANWLIEIVFNTGKSSKTNCLAFSNTFSCVLK